MAAAEKGVKNVIIGLDPIIYFFVIQRFTKRDSRVGAPQSVLFMKYRQDGFFIGGKLI